jgi:SH3-like domain-containing protein
MGPVEWVYHRRHLPVEVIAEFDTWRKVRDWVGSQGWVHQSMLSAHRAIIVAGKPRTLRHEPEAAADAVAVLQPGVVGDLLQCPKGSQWCRVTASGYEGWLRRNEIWGVGPMEVVR